MVLNRLIEPLVQTFKKAMKAEYADGKTLQHQLARFFLSYRTLRHATTNVELSKTCLYTTGPDLAAHIAEKQAAQKKAHDGRRKGENLLWVKA